MLKITNDQRIIIEDGNAMSIVLHQSNCRKQPGV